MPNLRSKTWTTTTPATVEDAQHWEDHLISDATLNALEAAKHTHTNKTVLDSLTKDTDGDLNFEGSKINGVSDSFGHVKVGSTTIDASGDDTVEFVAGSNVTLSANGKTVTINASGGGGGTSTGDMLKSEFVLEGGTGQVLSAKNADSVGTATTSVLEKFSEDSNGKPTYNGSAIGGGGQGGSVLYVSTSTFIGSTVSVSITDTVTGITETASTTFGSNGKASFNLISIGVATITVVDGSTTYTSTCSISCYSVYEAPAINRFGANITVTAKCGDSVVEGAEVIVNGSPSGKLTNASGVAVVTVSEKGAYSIQIKKDNVTSANSSTVSVTSESARTCTVNIARIKYTFDGALSATVTGSSFSKSISSVTSPVYVYVPTLQTYSLAGTLGEYEVSATTAVNGYSEFETSVTVFNSTINVSTVTGAVVTAISGSDVFTATAAAGVASVTVRKVGTYSISATIDGVTSEDTKTVTISADGETKTASVAFASIKLTFDGTLVASVTKGSFTKQINTSTSPYTFYVPSTGNYELNGTINNIDVSLNINVLDYVETEEIVSAKYVTINVETEENDLSGAFVYIYKGESETPYRTTSFSSVAVSGKYNAQFIIQEADSYVIKSTYNSETAESDTITITSSNLESQAIITKELSFLSIVTWADGTDEQIVKMIQAHYAGKINLTDYWSVGQKRKMTISAIPATSVQQSFHSAEYEYVIAGMNHHTKEDGNKAILTIVPTSSTLSAGSKYSLSSNQSGGTNSEYLKMNSTNTNVGGWRDSLGRQWCNNNYYNALPSTIRNAIKTVSIPSTAGNQSTTIINTLDKVFFLSVTEVYGADGVKYRSTTTTTVEGSQLDYYKTSSNRNIAPPWTSAEDLCALVYLRTSIPNSTSQFWGTFRVEGFWDFNASQGYPALPAFCL